MKNERGAILLIVLWVLIIMTVMALQLSQSVRIEGMTADAYQQEVKAYYLARAGLNRALYHFLAAESQGRTLLSLQASVEVEPEPADVWIRADGSWFGENFGEGGYRTRVSDEGAKINLNRVDELVLKQAFLNLGLEQEIAEGLTDGILDWRDADDLERLNGAESEYYLSLPLPYAAKDALFDSVDELVLIHGVTRQLFFGEGGPALREIFTVHGGAQRQINLLTASPAVLQAALGIDSDLAQELVQRRAETGSAELSALLPPGVAARAGSRLPTILSVESEGYLSNSSFTRRISAVVRRTPGALPQMLRWQDWQFAS